MSYKEKAVKILKLTTMSPTSRITLQLDLFDEVDAEIAKLKAAINKTLADNGNLADGDDCTLIDLKWAVGIE